MAQQTQINEIHTVAIQGTFAHTLHEDELAMCLVFNACFKFRQPVPSTVNSRYNN